MEAVRWRTPALALALALTGLTLVLGGVAAEPAKAEPLPAAPTTPPAGADTLLDSRPRTAGAHRYIVAFKSGVADADASATADALGEAVRRRLTIFPGLIADLTPAQRTSLALNPAVRYVEPDHQVTASTTEVDPPWGLDRIDQPGSDLDSRYTYNSTGAGVRAYVIDTGIYAEHSEFGGRVKGGATGINDGRGTGDCAGHGTHVAGTIGGATYGVAKQVTLVPVRVLDCSGSGYNSTVVAGMDWVVSQHAAHTPAVVNMSLGGGYSTSINDAVQRLVSDGVTVVVAAGNSSSDACSFSPASAPAALTVAAANAADHEASFSNYGSCVDLYAPGVNILSSYLGSPNASAYLSGTSMASPHVAGVAALILSVHHTWSPAQVSGLITGIAGTGHIADPSAGTPNLLLAIAPAVAAVAGDSGRRSGGQTVTVTGTGFASVQGVYFGAAKGTHLSVTSGTRLTVRTPKHSTEEIVPVRVVTRYSTSTVNGTFRYAKAPTVSLVAPKLGSTLGGTRVTVTGTRFYNVRKVWFGGVRARDVLVSSSGSLSATAPAHGTGTVQVRVESASGTSATSSADTFTYGRPPAVTRVAATSGSTEGGATVTLTGTRFSGSTSVTFGGVAATDVVVVSSTKVTATVPAHSAGTVDVRVQGRYGLSPISAAARYTYLTPPGPTIGSLSPSTGTTAGGTVVTITGTDFIGITDVTFGGTSAAGVTVVSPTRITLTTPPHAAGPVDVQVIGRYGTSPLWSGDGFLYATP